MAGYIFRARRTFTLEELAGLEGVYVEDLDPSSPVVGTGSGVVCLIGEFDDGPIGTLTEIEGGDLTRQFGSLGYTYGGVPACNPCARVRGGELWNGNGFIYSRYIKAPRFLVVRVDTSVGEVAFSPLALVRARRGPYRLTVGDTLAITTSQGTASSPAIAATAANRAGTAAITTTGFTGGEQISVQIDAAAAPVVVTFAASDQTAAEVVTRINEAVGAVVASQAAGTVTVRGLIAGTEGHLVLADVTPGALAALHLTAGTYAGTGNVADLALVGAEELAALLNGAVALDGIGAKAAVGEDGTLRLYDETAGDGSISVAAGAMATTLGLERIGAVVRAGEHTGGVIRAGTRVRTAGGAEWVTMESVRVAAGTADAPNVGPHRVRVRPAMDDGTALGAAADSVTVLVDPPSFSAMAVVNQQALSAALGEGQLDAAYMAAIDQTLDASGLGTEINYLYSARRSFAVDVYAADKTEEASNTGCAGRKYLRGGALGITKAQAKEDAARLRSDRVWYAWPGWQVVIPEILRRGAAGGLGFSNDGVVTIRGHGPLVKLSALLPPEENIGQQTGLLTHFFATEPLGYALTPDDYRDLKAAGICAPRIDRTAGSIYQSAVTTDLTRARSTQARRKMADFVQDSLARLLIRYSKKLAKESRRDACVGDVDGFLAGLKSAADPERQRIADYVVDLSANTRDTEALGIFVLITRVRTLSSLDAIELRTEIGEGVLTITEAA